MLRNDKKESYLKQRFPSGRKLEETLLRGTWIRHGKSQTKRKPRTSRRREFQRGHVIGSTISACRFSRGSGTKAECEPRQTENELESKSLVKCASLKTAVQTPLWVTPANKLSPNPHYTEHSFLLSAFLQIHFYHFLLKLPFFKSLL